MHIVFLGNCQVAAVSAILRRFVGPYVDYTSDFVNAYERIDESSYTRLAAADIVVAQSASQPPVLDHSHIPAGAKLHLIPLVSGAFLYPNRGIEHPITPVAGYGNPPYQPEYNDRHLASLIGQGVAPQAALDRYRAFDVASQSRAGRVFEMTMDAQRVLDQASGYDCAAIIETWLAREQVFQSAYHFGNRIGRHIASILCERLGFGEPYASRIAAHLDEPPFVARFVPVHPSIARHFGMEWVREDTRYPFLWEGAYTFDDYVLRFMRAEWCPVLQEGIIDARESKPGARAKLEEGLRACPHSATGTHELSRIVEDAQGLEPALALQERAVACEPSSARLGRLSALRRKSGDLEGAADALARWTVLDPFSPNAWTHLRNLLTKLGRDAEALHAAGQAVLLAQDPKPAEAIRARLAACQARSPAEAPASRPPIRTVLHVGPHKTGTTYLQLCLQALRPALKARGVVHPAIWEHAPGAPSHARLAQSLAAGEFGAVSEDLRALASPDIDTLVISSEMLSTLDEAALTGLRTCLAETLGGPVTIVFYLRRWSEIVPSMWQEQVKQGGAATLPELMVRVLRDPVRSTMLNWDIKLAPLVSCFGRDAIRLVPYSVLRDDAEDLFAHFAAAFLDWPDYLPPPLPPPNASRDVREIELIRALNVVAARHGEHATSTMRERFDRRPGTVDPAALYEAMERHRKSLRFNDSLPSLAALHQRLFDAYEDRLVQPRLAKRLFKPRAADLDYIGADYLAEPGAAAALHALYAQLAG